MSHSQSPNTCVGALATRLAGLDAGGVVEFRDPVIEDGVGFGELVALALAGDDVQKLRPLELLLRFCSVGTRASRSWPSIGPM